MARKAGREVIFDRENLKRNCKYLCDVFKDA